MHKVEFEVVDLLQQSPTTQELDLLLESFQTITKLLNTSGLLYREGNYKEKFKAMDKAAIFQTLQDQPMLIKRPLYFSAKKKLVGFKEKQWKPLE
jgi:Spx/MgsR family transcriptional regulator